MPTVSFALASRVIWVLNSHVGTTGIQLTYNLPPSRTSGRVYRTSFRFGVGVSTENRVYGHHESAYCILRSRQSCYL
eukprot:805332-Pyramimonas_sp.AAC.1